MRTHLEHRRLARRLAACAAAAAVAWVASVGLPAQAAVRPQQSRMLDKSAARAQDLAASEALPSGESSAAASAASGASAASAAPAASAASAAAPPASAASAPTKDKIAVTLSLGAAFTSDDTSHSRTTPFLLVADRGNWHGEIGGDGQSRHRGDKTFDAFSDVAALVAYNFVHRKLTVQPRFQWTFPAGNDAGSKRSGQEVGLKFLQTFNDNWSFSVTPSLDRDTEDDARKPQYGRTLGAKLGWQLAAKSDTQASIKVARDRPAGERADTTVWTEFDFPICKKLDGTVTLSRKVAGSKSANTAEFDLTWSF